MKCRLAAQAGWAGSWINSLNFSNLLLLPLGKQLGSCARQLVTMTAQPASGAYHLVLCLCDATNTEEECRSNSFVEEAVATIEWNISEHTYVGVCNWPQYTLGKHEFQKLVLKRYDNIPQRRIILLTVKRNGSTVFLLQCVYFNLLRFRGKKRNLAYLQGEVWVKFLLQDFDTLLFAFLLSFKNPTTLWAE